MSEEQGAQSVKSVTVLRKIIRADGTEEPQEVVAYWDRDKELERSVLAGRGPRALADVNGNVDVTAERVGAVRHMDEAALVAMRGAR